MIKNYTTGEKPLFIEGNVFKTIIPIEKKKIKSKVSKDRLYDTINDTVNDTVKKRLAKELILIQSDKKHNIADLAQALKVSEITIKRDVKILRDARLIQFIGAAKTGYYAITESFSDKLSL